MKKFKVGVLRGDWLCNDYDHPWRVDRLCNTNPWKGTLIVTFDPSLGYWADTESGRFKVVRDEDWIEITWKGSPYKFLPDEGECERVGVEYDEC